jgi:hypothetical protein
MVLVNCSASHPHCRGEQMLPVAATLAATLLHPQPDTSQLGACGVQLRRHAITNQHPAIIVSSV